MNETDLEAVRKLIRRSKSHELETNELKELLNKELQTLHHSIRLPEQNAVIALMDLVINYVESVPDCIAAIESVAEEAGIKEYTDVFVAIARDFFLKPPQSLKDDPGLAALMGESYLAHRLMEEINDRFIGRCGLPLIPNDMTLSNLVVHELIGEKFANELDMAVQYSLELCIARERVFESPQFKRYAESLRQKGQYNILEDWPCLAEEKAIRLEFANIEDYSGALTAAPGKSLH